MLSAGRWDKQSWAEQDDGVQREPRLTPSPDSARPIIPNRCSFLKINHDLHLSTRLITEQKKTKKAQFLGTAPCVRPEGKSLRP